MTDNKTHNRIPRKLKKLCKRIAIRNREHEFGQLIKSKGLRISDVVKGEGFTVWFKKWEI